MPDSYEFLPELGSAHVTVLSKVFDIHVLHKLDLNLILLYSAILPLGLNLHQGRGFLVDSD